MAHPEKKVNILLETNSRVLLLQNESSTALISVEHLHSQQEGLLGGRVYGFSWVCRAASEHTHRALPVHHAITHT